MRYVRPLVHLPLQPIVQAPRGICVCEVEFADGVRQIFRRDITERTPEDYQAEIAKAARMIQQQVTEAVAVHEPGQV